MEKIKERMMTSSPRRGRPDDDGPPQPRMKRVYRRRIQTLQPNASSPTDPAPPNTHKDKRQTSTSVQSLRCRNHAHSQARPSPEGCNVSTPHHGLPRLSAPPLIAGAAQTAPMISASPELQSLPNLHVYQPRPVPTSQANFLQTSPQNPRVYGPSNPLTVVRLNTNFSAPNGQSVPSRNVPPQQQRADKDGYKVLRHAVSSLLASNLAAVIDSGLPCLGQGESHVTFAPPLGAYALRDDFMNVSTLDSPPCIDSCPRSCMSMYELEFFKNFIFASTP